MLKETSSHSHGKLSPRLWDARLMAVGRFPHGRGTMNFSIQKYFFRAGETNLFLRIIHFAGQV